MLDCGGEWLDKPADMTAAATLRHLRGQTHQPDPVGVARGPGAMVSYRPGSICDATFRTNLCYLKRIGEAALSSVGAYQPEGLVLSCSSASTEFRSSDCHSFQYSLICAMKGLYQHDADRKGESGWCYGMANLAFPIAHAAWILVARIRYRRGLFAVLCRSGKLRGSFAFAACTRNRGHQSHRAA